MANYIPTYDQARLAVDNGNPTKLSLFVINNEPGGKEDIVFRNDLAEVLKEATGQEWDPQN